MPHFDKALTILQRKLAWLQEEDAEGQALCRVLTNARCLTEGVDVPALDAVVFLAPRKSQVDVVQAVGRVMRRAKGKQMGYIILPVVAGPDQEPEQALDDNKTFQVVWSVLRALRSHDDRFDLEINSLDLNRSPSKRVIVVDGNGGGIASTGRSGRPTSPRLRIASACVSPA